MPHVFIVYILAQVAGGLVGAASTYGQYVQPINIYKDNTNRTMATAGLFAPFPVSNLDILQIWICLIFSKNSGLNTC
jgi:glycerol uptake facilitator-like aquaporin